MEELSGSGEEEPSEIDLVIRLSRHLRRGAVVETAPWGLSPHQARALAAIVRPGRRAEAAGAGLAAPVAGPRVRDLAERLEITPRSVTEVADGLEQHGLVRRVPDPLDRRAVRLAATAEGLRVAAEIRTARRLARQQATDVLDDAERTELRRLLTRLVQAMEQDAAAGH